MNGCICCTTREDLHTAMMEMKKKYIDNGKIDYVIIEATGMADPEPILQTFLLNDDIAEWAKIDSCLTICDASQIKLRLEEDREEGVENEAVDQVAFADKIFLNKIDLCDRETLDKATEAIRVHNKFAKIEEVQFIDEESPLDKILNLDMFSIKRALEIDTKILTEDDADHKHDSRIGSFAFKVDAEMTAESVEGFFENVLAGQGENIYRMKGFLAVQGSEKKFVFHSVGCTFSCQPLTKWKEDEKRESVLVIIGKNLDEEYLREEFKAAMVEGSTSEIETMKPPAPAEVDTKS